MIKVLFPLAIGFLAALPAFSQQRDSTLFPNQKVEQDGDFKHGKGVDVDTLDINDANFMVVLSDNGTWRYIRNLDKLSADAVFTECWDSQNVNPYASRVNIGDLSFRNTIVLQDSVSKFTSPYIGRKSSSFGWRWGRRHQGVDLPLHTGDPIKAMFDGRVRMVKKCSGYGNLVIIRHPNGLETFYGHLSSFKVNEGQWVHSGETIGLGGSTGRSTGPHLHLEIRYRGFAFDPEWIADYGTGTLRKNVFVLKQSYLDPSSRYVPTSDDEEFEINEADEQEEARIAAEQARIAAEKARREAERNAQRWHTVRSGETLSSIAVKYHTSTSAITRLNPKINPNRLSIGQKVRVK